MHNLQLLQNSTARVVTKTRGREHITPDLKSLHWLPVRFGIHFKLLLLVFKCLNGLGPSYLSDLLSLYQPSWTLRSSSAGLLLHQVRTKTHEEAAFSYYGPRLWNSLSRASEPQRLLMLLILASRLIFLVSLFNITFINFMLQLFYSFTLYFIAYYS